MRRRLGFFFIIGAAVSLIAVSTAWACGVLATVTLDKTSAAPGSVVNFTGKNYNSTAAFGPVQLHLNTRTAPALPTTPATITPVGSNRISGSFTLPAGLSPGWYAVLATQYNATTGAPKSGTPGRTSIRVQGAAAAKHGGTVVTPWGSSSKPTGGSGASLALNSGSSSSAFLPTLLGIMLSLGLLGTGLTLVARSRSADRPQPGA
jgi:hypothetical protein